MAIKLNNLDKWLHVTEGEVVTLGGGSPDHSRLVRVNVNAPFETRLYLGVDKPAFLAVVTGLETVEFNVVGEVDIHGDGPFSMYTAEFEQLAVEIPDAETFTKIMERRHRNPELEYIMHKTMMNMETRFAQRERDLLDRINAGGSIRVPSNEASGNDQPSGGDEQPGDGAEGEGGDGTDTGAGDGS